MGIFSETMYTKNGARALFPTLVELKSSHNLKGLEEFSELEN
jgi:hypothetical protein